MFRRSQSGPVESELLISPSEVYIFRFHLIFFFNLSNFESCYFDSSGCFGCLVITVANHVISKSLSFYSRNLLENVGFGFSSFLLQLEAYKGLDFGFFFCNGRFNGFDYWCGCVKKKNLNGFRFGGISIRESSIGKQFY